MTANRLFSRDIALVENSFSKIVPNAQPFADLFFERLFLIAPGLRPMFRDDLTRLSGQVVSTLATIVVGLNDLSKLCGLITGLAKRHAGYGVKEEHFEPVGEALIWALEKSLGEAFDDEMRQAWSLAYDAMSREMIAALAQVREDGATLTSKRT